MKMMTPQVNLPPCLVCAEKEYTMEEKQFVDNWEIGVGRQSDNNGRLEERVELLGCLSSSRQKPLELLKLTR